MIKLADPNATSDAKTVDDQVTAEGRASFHPHRRRAVDGRGQGRHRLHQGRRRWYKLTNLSELPRTADITIGASEFETRSHSVKGSPTCSGGKFKACPVAASQAPHSLNSGAIDCGNLFSTTPEISSNGFVALADDQTLVPHEAVLPLLTTAAATPEVLQAVDPVSAQLTTDALTAMLVKTNVEKQSFDTVAKAFLNGEFTTATTVPATGDTTVTTTAGATASTTGAPTTTTQATCDRCPQPDEALRTHRHVDDLSFAACPDGHQLPRPTAGGARRCAACSASTARRRRGDLRRSTLRPHQPPSP